MDGRGGQLGEGRARVARRVRRADACHAQVALVAAAAAIERRMPQLRCLRVGRSRLHVQWLRLRVRAPPTNARYTKHIRLAPTLEAAADENEAFALTAVAACYLRAAPQQP